MPYSRRNADGQIDRLHRLGDGSASAFLSDGHPDVRAFVDHAAAPDKGFSRPDADIVRAIDTLVIQNILNITELADQAQAKLFARRSCRERVSRQSLRPFGQPTGFGDVIEVPPGMRVRASFHARPRNEAPAGASHQDPQPCIS
jgi:hypothetical protein